MDEAPIKVGVIGVGYLGRFHAEKYAHLQDTELVGVADLNQARAVEVAQALGARAYTDYQETVAGGRGGECGGAHLRSF